MQSNHIKIIKKFCIPTIIIATILAFISYNYFFITDKNDLNKVCSEINNINSYLLKDIKGSVIDVKSSISTLTDIQAKLINQKNELDTLSIPKKYDDERKLLQLSLSQNIKMCEQIIAMLKNQNSNDLSSSLTNLQTTYEICNSNYIKSKSAGFDCKFDKTFEPFYKNTCIYINEVIKIKRDNDIDSQQRTDFYNTMTGYEESFTPLTEDLSPAINRAKYENRSLNNIINDVYEKQSSLEKIKDSVALISFPSDCTSIYNQFNSLLDKYTDYISCLLDTLKKDIKTGSESYNLADLKYSDMMKCYSEFEASMNNFSK